MAGEGTYGRVWGYMVGCGHMWQGVGQGVGECGVGHAYGIDWDMWQGWGIW